MVLGSQYPHVFTWKLQVVQPDEQSGLPSKAQQLFPGRQCRPDGGWPDQGFQQHRRIGQCLHHGGNACVQCHHQQWHNLLFGQLWQRILVGYGQGRHALVHKFRFGSERYMVHGNHHEHAAQRSRLEHRPRCGDVEQGWHRWCHRCSISSEQSVGGNEVRAGYLVCERRRFRQLSELPAWR